MCGWHYSFKWVMDRGMEFKECKVGVRKYTGNFNEGTSKGEDFYRNKKGVYKLNVGTTGGDADCLS